MTPGTPPTILHVSPEGSDSWSGQLAEPNSAGSDGPFATLERARDQIRALRQAGSASGDVKVEIAGGLYARADPFQLTAADSGTAAAPVTYAVQEGEIARLIGGQVLHGFVPVTDERILQRLPAEARGQVMQIDLRKQGIQEYGDPSGGGLELFFNGQPQTLARWPNEDFVQIAGLVGGDPVDVRGTKGDRIGKFFYQGDRPARWAREQDPWVHGYWFWDWSDQRQRVERIDSGRGVIELAEPYHNYGYRTGQWYYAYNLLCELDSPGEWYLDRQCGMLYFWPPGELADAEVSVSVADTLVRVQNVAHVELCGLNLELCRDTAIVASDSSHVRIRDCVFTDLGNWAVRAEGGQEFTVTGCDIDQVGGGGIALTGGDREQLTPAGHRAENNHIHDYGRVYRMYRPAIQIGGVGQRVAHNLIHDAPHMAVQFSGNDHVIELNEIHHVCLESNDAGAIYSGRDWTWRGTAIRHNLFYEITGFRDKGCVGVYLDDMLCGTLIQGNLFYRVTRAAMIGGGRDCVIENNIFVDCDPAVHVDARALNWASYHVGTTMKERLDAMPVDNPRWASRYPELPRLWGDEPGAPKGNVIRRNVCQGGRWDGIRDDARGYVHLEDNLVADDVGLAGQPPRDFRLRPDSPAFALGFQPIPQDRIGMRR